MAITSNVQMPAREMFPFFCRIFVELNEEAGT
jgi:hypothetical protein